MYSLIIFVKCDEQNYTPKPGEYLPFGIGSRFCPGSELTKLYITILLHHFILNYK